jgi:signal peptidase II
MDMEGTSRGPTAVDARVGISVGTRIKAAFPPLMIAVGALVVMIDQATKLAARIGLAECVTHSDCPQVGIMPWLGLARGSNAGSALGFSQGLWLWTALAVAALMLSPLYARRGGGRRWLVAAAGLQLGGAAGNLLDRLLAGGVTDFIRIGPGPSESTDTWSLTVINLADVCLAVGMVVGVIQLLRAERAAD